MRVDLNDFGSWMVDAAVGFREISRPDKAGGPTGWARRIYGVAEDCHARQSGTGMVKVV
jgi:hypothetical protein